MTYDFLVIGQLDETRLAAALASLAVVPIEAVDVATSDTEDRDWSAEVLCTYEQVAGDVDWRLDIYLAETIPRPLTESEAATSLAQQLDTPVLYPAPIPLPSAYWLVAPGGFRTRARLKDVENGDQIRHVIDAVEQPVPSLPSIPITPLSEVIREYRIATPVTDAVVAKLAQEQINDSENTLRQAQNYLSAWESLTSRMGSGWPPDGWYPAEFYREDLEARDTLATIVEKLPEPARQQFSTALQQVDDNFRRLTRYDEQSALMFDAHQTNPPRNGWWWRRDPHSGLVSTV